MAWLFARSAGGRFLLRVEDLDPDRSRPGWERLQRNALLALGIDADGEIVRQSTRTDAYATATATLVAQRLVYPCFCTRAEIRAAASAPHDGRPADAYPGTCRRLSPDESATRIARGERHALRFDAGGQRVRFSDRLAGEQDVVVDDFVLRRSDGVTAYQLAVVVDDAFQGITEVVRGADLLDSAGRQLLLMRALELPEPTWAHVPLVLGPDGRRLAKRHGSEGDPHAPLATLALLAGSLGLTPTRPPRRAADLLESFDPTRIPSAPFVAA